jgi:hypothetical protein
MVARYWNEKGSFPSPLLSAGLKINPSKATNQYTEASGKGLLCCCYEARDGGTVLRVGNETPGSGAMLGWERRAAGAQTDAPYFCF